MRVNKSLLIGLVFGMLLLVACSDDDDADSDDTASLENLNEEGMPIVKETIELDVFAGKAPTTADDWNDVLILNEYEEMTNMIMNWEQVPLDGLSERRNLALASGDLPDLFYAAYIPPADLLKYGQQGTFIPLNDLIDEYAPNLKRILDENPDIKKGLTFPDGNIYSFPTIYSPDFTSMLIGAKPWINQEWLDQLGMDNPETTEELYEYLKAVKETDLNGNGEHDEIPLSSIAMERIIHWIAGSFGIGNKGNILHRALDIDPETNELRFYPISDEYREMLEYLNKLYSEGLIEQNIYSISVDQYLANAQEGLYGATVFFNPIELFGEEIGSKYVGGNALEGPFGDKMYAGVTSPLFQIGNFAITSENKHPEATVRWMDYFFSDEGAKMFFMGIEGVTYEETPDGPVLKDEIVNSPDGLTVTQELAKYLINPGGGHPVMIEEDYFTGSEANPADIEVAEKLSEYLPEEVWPTFTFTEEENNELTNYSDISKYVDEMQAKFITGEIPFSEWDDYVKTIEDLGLEEYMRIQEQAYNRYLEN